MPVRCNKWRGPSSSSSSSVGAVSDYTNTHKERARSSGPLRRTSLLFADCAELPDGRSRSDSSALLGPSSTLAYPSTRPTISPTPLCDAPGLSTRSRRTIHGFLPVVGFYRWHIYDRRTVSLWRPAIGGARYAPRTCRSHRLALFSGGKLRFGLFSFFLLFLMPIFSLLYFYDLLNMSYLQARTTKQKTHTDGQRRARQREFRNTAYRARVHFPV